MTPQVMAICPRPWPRHPIPILVLVSPPHSELKGQAIEEYRPDLSLNKPAAGASSAAFFDEPEECVDPVTGLGMGWDLGGR